MSASSSRPIATVALAASGGFIAFSAAVLINQYYRMAMALMAPGLAADLGLTADKLGLLAAAYFLAFSAMQLPVGMLLDRFGPRRSAAGLMTIGLVGALVFATAPVYPLLVLGQMLIGIGTAAALTGGIVICTRWFPPERAATMTGFMLGVGNLGGLIAARFVPPRTSENGAVSVGLHVARHLRDQGHGVLVVLSSVAGDRARRSSEAG